MRRASLRRLALLPSFFGAEDIGGYDFCGFGLLNGVGSGTGLDMSGRRRVSRVDFDLRKMLSIMMEVAGDPLLILGFKNKTSDALAEGIR